MKTFTIPKKTADSGTICDFASETGDRVIKFPKNHHYAVVLASMYCDTENGRGYTVHRSKQAVLAKMRKLNYINYKVIDACGNAYILYYGKLSMLDRPLR
jgi:hypothetical protein